MFENEDHVKAVLLARATIEKELGSDDVAIPKIPGNFNTKTGVFVTLNRYPGKELRGCIGFPEPIMPLKDALKEASISAATRDPRFPPVEFKEMDSIIIDVTILTPPEDILYTGIDDLISHIKIGRDGLIARRSFLSGLLLPQVPVEWGWDVEEFLTHTCMKAGMPGNEWRNGKVKFQKFTGRVFGEKEPRGDIMEMELS